MSAVTARKLPRTKLALLHVAKRDLALADEDYRAILRRFAGVESSRDLDELGFLKVTQHLAGLGFRSTWTKRTFGNRPGMASPAQVELIRSLWRRYRGAADEGDQALNAWLSRFHRVAALRFVSGELAGKIIPGLRAMAARDRGEGDGQRDH